MLIDMHTHLWLSMAGQNRRDLARLREQYGLTRIGVSSLGCFDPDAQEIERLNSMTLRYMQEEPDFVWGYCYLNPRNPNVLDELERRLDQGMVAVKLWVATRCDDPLVFPIVERCIQRRTPVLIHAFHKAVGQLPFESLGTHVAALARRYPESRLIMAHMGAACYRELHPIRTLNNVWTDFSGSIAHPDDLAYALELLGSRRVLFGTDAPLGGFHVSYGQLKAAGLTQEAYDDLAWRNSMNLFSGGGR